MNRYYTFYKKVEKNKFEFVWIHYFWKWIRIRIIMNQNEAGYPWRNDWLVGQFTYVGDLQADTPREMIDWLVNLLM